MTEPSSSSPPTEIDNLPIPVLRRSPSTVTDTRMDAILRRFDWFANPDHVWTTTISLEQTPRVYHLRQRPQIHCPACLQGELGQMAHMQGPNGCLYTEEVSEEEKEEEPCLDRYYYVDE